MHVGQGRWAARAGREPDSHDAESGSDSEDAEQLHGTGEQEEHEEDGLDEDEDVRMAAERQLEEDQLLELLPGQADDPISLWDSLGERFEQDAHTAAHGR